MADGRLEYDCGIAFARIRSWLQDERVFAREDDDWVFGFEGSWCRIQAERLEPRELGVVQLERTKLVATGDDRAIGEFERLFTLRFMSAGG